MKKNRFLLLILITFISFCFSMQRVQAVLCNIGMDGNSKGYGSVSLKNIKTDISFNPGVDLQDNNYNNSKLPNGWYNSREFDLNIHAKIRKGKDSRIGNYNIQFYNDEKKLLCEINNRNGGIGIEGNDGYLRFHFNLTSGHVSYFKVEYNYSYNGSDLLDTKSKKIKVKKAVGNTGSVSNIEKTTTPKKTPTASVDGFYICSGKCGRKNKGESLKNCNEAPHMTKVDCEKALKEGLDSITKVGGEVDIKSTVTSKTAATAKDVDGVGGPAAGIEKASNTKKITKIGSGDRQLACDTIGDLFDKYWPYIMAIIPILLIIMMSIDFFKAMVVNDADALKKAGSDAVKRTIATVILLALPALLRMIFGLFGIDFCL